MLLQDKIQRQVHRIGRVVEDRPGARDLTPPLATPR
jgi:hypothetical protein